MNDILLTIFTPTYNREKLLPTCYHSLKRQTNKNFIWLIIDDGSSDHTKELVEKWIEEESEFEIKYFYKKNGGMHTAHNAAYRKIDTELSVNLDSDDYFADNAVEIIYNIWEHNKAPQYAGIVGLDADLEGKIICPLFPYGLKAVKIYEFREKFGGGDVKTVYRTDIMKKVPEYLEIEGEKYGSMGYKSAFVEKDYWMIPVNEVLCYVEYRADGSTRNMLSQYYNNPNGFAKWRIVEYNCAHTLKRKYMICGHYISSCLIAKRRDWLRQAPSKILCISAIPFGLVLTCIIYLDLKRRKE